MSAWRLQVGADGSWTKSIALWSPFLLTTTMPTRLSWPKLRMGWDRKLARRLRLGIPNLHGMSRTPGAATGLDRTWLASCLFGSAIRPNSEECDGGQQMGQGSSLISHSRIREVWCSGSTTPMVGSPQEEEE